MAHLNEPQQGEAPGEDTNVYVKRLLASRGKTRRPVMIGLAILTVLVTLMALKWGSRRHEELMMEGPVYDVKAGDTVTHEPTAPPATNEAPKQAKGAPAKVEVLLENPGALWVDGRELSGKGKRYELMLSPGSHSLTVHETKTKRVLNQKITVSPNEVFEVTFGNKIKVMRQAD